MTFRIWINEVWFEHVDEMLTWHNTHSLPILRQNTLTSINGGCVENLGIVH